MAGLFLLCSLASAGGDSLAVELFEAGDWAACRREFRRSVLSGTATVAGQYADAVAAVRMRVPPETARALFEPLCGQTNSPAIAAAAAYQCARLHWARGEREQAVALCYRAFVGASDTDLFLNAACTAFLIMEEAPRLRRDFPAFVLQIDTSRALWSGKLIARCRVASPETRRLTSMPAAWLVKAYRSQISPAIGRRCSLHPSCSEYFLQASRKHGLLGFPMIADRLFREPSVTRQRKNPVRIGDVTRYGDPLENHDFWISP